MFVDFKEVKRATTLELVAEWLGLQPRNNRSQCPINQGDKRELVINAAKQIWYCFGCKKGGDLIELASHVNATDQRTAALAIQKHFTGYEPAKRGLTTEAVDKINGELEYEHEAVQALGLTVERAKELGIGWRKKGTKANMVLIPIRNAKGEMIDYAGYSQERGLVFSKHMAK
jgi:DNA primase